MSRKRLWTYTVPTSLALIFLFQNCMSNNFAVLDSGSGLNLGSSTTPDGSLPLPPVNVPPEASDAGRRILSVCPSGCKYALPSEAAAAAADNDIIEVKAAEYNDCFDLNKNNIKLRGTNGRAHLTGKICGGKGEINITGTNTVIENFEFSGMANADTNGAGIRHQGINLIVRNSYFHDGEDGILSEGRIPSIAEDVVLVENSKFEHLGGGGGYSHAAYFGHHRLLTVKNSQFLSSQDQGHEFKSRAENVIINCSQLASLDGLDSYTLNFPDGGKVSVTNTTLEQGSATSNGVFIDFGSEMKMPFVNTVNQLNFTNVAFLNDRNSGTYFAVANTTQFLVTNSVLVGGGSLSSKQAPTIVGSKQLASRAEAGFQAYPSLPVPNGCGTIGLSN